MRNWRTQDTTEKYESNERDPLTVGRIVTSGSLYSTHTGWITKVLGNGEYIVTWRERSRKRRSHPTYGAKSAGTTTFILAIDTLNALNQVYQ